MDVMPEGAAAFLRMKALRLSLVPDNIMSFTRNTINIVKHTIIGAIRKDIIMLLIK